MRRLSGRQVRASGVGGAREMRGVLRFAQDDDGETGNGKGEGKSKGNGNGNSNGKGNSQCGGPSLRSG